MKRPSRPVKKSKLIRHHDTTLNGIGGPHWTIRVKFGETFCVADNIGLYVIIKNHGPGMIGIPGPHDTTEKLTAGALWVKFVAGKLSIEGMEDKSALVELDFLPRVS